MDSCKSELPTTCNIKCGIRRSHFTRLNIGPSHEPHVIIKKQIALGLALADKECGSVVDTLAIKLLQVNIAQNVDIVNENRFVVFKQWSRFS